MTDEERRERLITLIRNVAQQIAEAESLAVDSTDDQALRGASNELAQLKQMLKNLELKISSNQSRTP
jgi:hypothetical protein